MKTIEEIENYIKEQEQNGALLVTGKWGSGKTYLMRQIERKLNQGPQYLMAVVSLFGKYSLQGTTQGRYLTGGVPPVRFSM